VRACVHKDEYSYVYKYLRLYYVSKKGIVVLPVVYLGSFKHHQICEHIIKRKRLTFGSHRGNKRIICRIQTSKEICYHLVVVQGCVSGSQISSQVFNLVEVIRSR
jgi:hypothetical protein